MRSTHYAIAIAYALFFVGTAIPGEALAALTISSGATRNVTCSSGVCTATARTAVLNANDLVGMLANGDVKVVSPRIARDLIVATAIGWASTARLTLDAFRSITVKQAISITGTGAMTFVTNDKNRANPVGLLMFTGNGLAHFWDTSSSLIINGHQYVLASSIGGLASALRQIPMATSRWPQVTMQSTMALIPRHLCPHLEACSRDWGTRFPISQSFGCSRMTPAA